MGNKILYQLLFIWDFERCVKIFNMQFNQFNTVPNSFIFY